MGQEQSALVDEDVAPRKLSDRSVQSIASHIEHGQAKKIVVMVGAGISTAAGIPDFRSPGTGLYANLARLNLPYAEAVFDISYFRSNPLPFYTLAHELYPGNYRPTLAHCFIKLLSDKGLLLKLFTQNIDCLDRAAGVPADKIVEAHGSFASQSCIDCKTPYPADRMTVAIASRTAPCCQNTHCKGLVKPDIVFFGEPLPPSFHGNRSLPLEADLCIIMGTSLTVQPFASLPGLCRDDVPRLLINLERVGGIGARPDDVLLLESCDEGVRKLAKALKWEAALDDLWSKTKDIASRTANHTENNHKLTSDEALENEIANLTKEVGSSLTISKQRVDSLREGITGKTSDSTSESATAPQISFRPAEGKEAPNNSFSHGMKTNKHDGTED